MLFLALFLPYLLVVVLAKADKKSLSKPADYLKPAFLKTKALKKLSSKSAQITGTSKPLKSKSSAEAVTSTKSTMIPLTSESHLSQTVSEKTKSTYSSDSATETTIIESTLSTKSQPYVVITSPAPLSTCPLCAVGFMW